MRRLRTTAALLRELEDEKRRTLRKIFDEQTKARRDSQKLFDAREREMRQGTCL